MENDLSFLGNKEGFNLAVRHCKKVIEYLGRISKNINIADAINNSLDNGDLAREQINPILGTLIVDKYGYNYKSHNLSQRFGDFAKVADETKKWTGIDLIFSYFHPKLKQCAVNPKIMEQWEKVGDLAKDEIIVVYAKALGSAEDDAKISSKAIDALIDIFEGGEPKTDNDFISKTVKQAPAPKETPKQTTTPKQQGAPATKRKLKMSAKMSVQVTNELFHNGNVEAWKNIIESYNHKYPHIEIVVYYDNEVINNLNALFKWGKVKMGNVILFQAIGPEFKDLSKLKRYLFEGASSRFENFLDKDVNKVLNLF